MVYSKIECMLPSACFRSTVLVKSGLEFSWMCSECVLECVLFGAKWHFAWISSLWLIECVYAPFLLFVDGNSSTEQHGEMFSSGTNNIENKMGVWERACEREKTLPFISCQADGETGEEPIPLESLFKLWYKRYSEKTERPLTSLSCFIDCGKKIALGLNTQTKR